MTEQDIPSELVNGGDTRLHYHLEDRVTNAQLQQAERVVNVAANYSVTATDDLVNVSTASTITLPLARNGRKIQVTQTTANNITVIPTSPDTICGSTSVVYNVIWTSLDFKAITGGWIIV